MAENGIVLVVDDDALIGEAVTRILSRQGYRVETAADVEKAREKLLYNPYDLVITDLSMPGEDGMTLLGELKTNSPQLPVVMLTGRGTMEVAVKALRLGVNDFVTKPFRPEELVDIVNREVARYRDALPPGMDQSLMLSLDSGEADEIDSLLLNLRADINARCVLLIEGNGSVVAAKGAVDELNISALGALVAGDFAATAGIASLLGEDDAFKLNFHEGAQYSVYSGQVVPGIYLLVVFGPDIRLGMVLYYTKETLAKLKAVVKDAVVEPAAFQRRGTPQTPAPSSPSEPAPAAPSDSAPAPELGEEESLFSLDEIMGSGLLDDDLLANLEAQFSNMWEEQG